MQPKRLMSALPPFRRRPPAIRRVRLTRRSAPISFNNLVAMLEIDAALGRRDAFRRRLRRALNDAQRQGTEWLMNMPESDATICRLVWRAQK